MMNFGQQHPEWQADTEKKSTGRCDTQGWCNYNVYTGQDFSRILYSVVGSGHKRRLLDWISAVVEMQVSVLC